MASDLLLVSLVAVVPREVQSTSDTTDRIVPDTVHLYDRLGTHIDTAVTGQVNESASNSCEVDELDVAAKRAQRHLVSFSIDGAGEEDEVN